MENKKKKKIYVVGHKNPDTDSICSAIAYANLKRKITEDDYHARRAGLLNEETQYVLERFQVDPPKLLANVYLQVKDVDVNRTPGIPSNTSIKEAWTMMKKKNLFTVPVTKEQKLEGVIIITLIMRPITGTAMEKIPISRIMRMLSFWNGVAFSDFLKIRCRLRNTIAITARMITAPMPKSINVNISVLPSVTGALTSNPYTLSSAPQQSLASKPTKFITQPGATIEQTVAAVIKAAPTQWNTSKIFVITFPSLLRPFITNTSRVIYRHKYNMFFNVYQ